MVERAVAEARETFLVEHYRPGHTVGAFRQWAARVRDAAVELAGEGRHHDDAHKNAAWTATFVRARADMNIRADSS